MAGVFLFLLLVGCAAQRGPVLYPNEHLKAAGEDQDRQNIAECNRLAENYLKSQPGSEAAKGAAGGAVARAVVGGAVGAVTGPLGRGAAIAPWPVEQAGLFMDPPRVLNPVRCTKTLGIAACVKKGMNPSAGNKRSEAMSVDEARRGTTRDPLPLPVSHAKFTFQGLKPLRPGGGDSFSFYE